MNGVLDLFDFVGTAVFAITGALAAGNKRMDIFGVVVLGGVTALGGGTLRDVILGVQPVFWIADTRYLMIAALAAVATFGASRYWALRTLFETEHRGPSPIVDPDLHKVDPSVPEDATPPLHGCGLSGADLKMLYHDAAEALLPRG